jgi:biopolymer transport protein TolQ
MDIPVIEMIGRSGWAGRIIVLLLVLFSFITWAIVFDRIIFLSRAVSKSKIFKRRYDSLSKLSEIESIDNASLASPLGQMGKISAMEYRRILEDAQTHTGVKDWSFFLQNQFTMASDRMESLFMSLVTPFDKGVFLLAMISSIAPFLGLLGTVWGIMNSFFEIGNQGSASLPVVAPGIAEALITTIVGLVVALPALFFYNYFNHKAEKLENQVDEFKEILLVRLKREIFNLLYTERPGRPQVSQAPRT